MTRTLLKMLKGILYSGVVAACLASTPAQAQVEVRVYPPAWYVATTRPVYFEGRPAYWWGDRWYYREGRQWRHYREEPSYLRERRGGHERDRHYYGRDHDGGFRRR
jgi:hypothetical protein